MNSRRNHLLALKSDFEAGIESKVAIAKKHGISAVTLWRHAQKGEWNYGRLREDVLESLSEEAISRLGKLTGSIIEEHVLLLSELRRKILSEKDSKEIKLLSSQVDALVKCIKGERTALGLPNHIVGMTSEREEVFLEA